MRVRGGVRTIHVRAVRHAVARGGDGGGGCDGGCERHISLVSASSENVYTRAGRTRHRYRDTAQKHSHWHKGGRAGWHAPTTDAHTISARTTLVCTRVNSPRPRTRAGGRAGARVRGSLLRVGGATTYTPTSESAATDRAAIVGTDRRGRNVAANATAHCEGRPTGRRGGASTRASPRGRHHESPPAFFLTIVDSTDASGLNVRPSREDW